MSTRLTTVSERGTFWASCVTPRFSAEMTTLSIGEDSSVWVGADTVWLQTGSVHGRAAATSELANVKVRFTRRSQGGMRSDLRRVGEAAVDDDDLAVDEAIGVDQRQHRLGDVVGGDAASERCRLRAALHQ